MSLINVLNIIPKNPNTKFLEPYIFEITFEIFSEIKKEIEWKMLYVISDKCDEDQVLGVVKFNPINQLQIGQNKFEFKGEAPLIEKIPQNDILGAAAILLICLYDGNEFFRCGYYLNISFDNEEMNIKIPEIINASHLIRNLLYTKPRISIHYFEWEGNNHKNDSNEKIIINNNRIIDKENKQLQNQEEYINSNLEKREVSIEKETFINYEIENSPVNLDNGVILDSLLKQEYKIIQKDSKYKDYIEFKKETTKNKEYIINLFNKYKEKIDKYS